MSKDKDDPFDIKAALKASSGRGGYTTFHPTRPARRHPVNISKISDFIAPENMSLEQRLDDIMPSARGRGMSAKMRDKLRKKHGLPT